jgi:hypothetical protein
VAERKPPVSDTSLRRVSAFFTTIGAVSSAAAAGLA